jgi:uncharacterized protein
MTTAPELTVNVRELLRTPGAQRELHLREPLSDIRTPVAEVAGEVPISVDGRIESVVEGLLVTAEITADIRMECGRCLTEVRDQLTVDVQELFARSPAEAEEEGYAVLPGDVLPLDTMVRDALVLAFPALPRCRPDCAGLCPTCGADRNVTDCGHGDAVADVRWEPLGALRAALADSPDSREDNDNARPQA